MLNQYLKTKKIDYLLLPNCDQFFSEYLPNNQQRIKAITNFTGSNAIIVFGQQQNYFFTDGRYILQAQKQIDLSSYQILNISDYPLLSWLGDHGINKKIILIEQLTSIDFVEKIKTLKNLEIEFISLPQFDQILLENFNQNLKINNVNVDLNHDNNQSSIIYQLAKKITGVDDISKRLLIAKKINGDAYLITKSDDLCWLLNIRARDLENTPSLLAFAILYRDGSIDLFTDRKSTINLTLTKINYLNLNDLASHLNKIKNSISQFAIDYKNTNYFWLNILKQHDFKINPCYNLIENFKAIKNPVEIYGSKKAHFLDGLALTKFILWFKNQINNAQKNNSCDLLDEISAQEKLLEFRKQHQSFKFESFPAISGFAQNSAIIHYRATIETCKKISGNSVYLIDSGGQYLGDDFIATTDVTRTLLVSNKNSKNFHQNFEEIIKNYTLVLKGHLALARVKFPRGSSGANLDALARFYLWQDHKDFDHGTGHLVGSFLSVHEGPNAINKRNHLELLPNMILSNEPGFYLENHYGIRLENLQRIIEIDQKFLSFETLTLAPFEADLIDFRMITYPEKKWLRNYHQNILDQFIEHLDSQEKIQLKEICQPFLE